MNLSFNSCRMILRAVVVVVLLASVLVDFSHASLTTEISSNSVEIKLYPMSESDWSSEQADFASALATQTETYCAANLATCTMDNSVTFNSSTVVTYSAEDDSKSMKVSVYIIYPHDAIVSSGASTQYLLPKAAVEAILEDSRDEVKDATDAYITYIGSEYYGIPPSDTENAVIIPIAIIVVVAVGIVAIALVKWQANKEREDRRLARLAKKKPDSYGTTRTLPQYNILDATISTTAEGTPRINSASNNSKIGASDNYARYHSEKEPMGAKSATITMQQNESYNHFHDNNTDMKNGGLPPLEDKSKLTEEERKERKRRKKEKRREKRKQRENELEMYDNHGLDTSNITDSESRPNNIPTFTVRDDVVA